MQKTGAGAGHAGEDRREGGLFFRSFRGRNFDAELMKIGFKGFFDDDIRGATPVNRKMANDFDDFGPEPKAGLCSVYVTLGPRHVKKIERTPQSVNIIILTQYNNGITVLYIIGIDNYKTQKQRAHDRRRQ